MVKVGFVKKGKLVIIFIMVVKKLIGIIVLAGLMNKLIILFNVYRNVTLINHRCLVYRMSILNGILG